MKRNFWRAEDEEKKKAETFGKEWEEKG